MTNTTDPAHAPESPAEGVQVQRPVRPLAWMPVLGHPLAIPAALLSAPQAMENHGQTLERLAERGGLSLQEAAALAEGRGWRSMTTDEALNALQKAGARRGIRVA